MPSLNGDFAVGTLVGVAATEIFKLIGSQVFKRKYDKSEGQRKLIREDAQSLLDKIEPVLELAADYYGKPSDSGVETANKIRSSLKSFAMQWNSINMRIDEIGGTKMAGGPLISFRQALTSKLDLARDSALSIESLELTQIYSAATKAHDELSRVRFQMT